VGGDVKNFTSSITSDDSRDGDGVQHPFRRAWLYSLNRDSRAHVGQNGVVVIMEAR